MPKPKKQAKPKGEQSERFIKKARELEADETGEKFERAFKVLVPPKKTKPVKDQS